MAITLHPQPSIAGVLQPKSGNAHVILRVDTGAVGQGAVSHYTLRGTQYGPFADSFEENLGEAGELIGSQLTVTTVVYDLSEGTDEATWDLKVSAGSEAYDPPQQTFTVPNEKEGAVYQALVLIL